MFDDLPSSTGTWWAMKDAIAWIDTRYSRTNRGDYLFEGLETLNVNLIAGVVTAHGSIDGQPLREIRSEVWRQLAIVPYWPFLPKTMKSYGAIRYSLLVQSHHGYPADKVQDRSEPWYDPREPRHLPNSNPKKQLFHIVVKDIVMRRDDIIRVWPNRLSEQVIERLIKSPQRRAGRMHTKIAQTLPLLPVRGGGSILKSRGPYTVAATARRLVALWTERGDPQFYNERSVERALHHYYQRVSIDLVKS